jgi:hypothetical protein
MVIKKDLIIVVLATFCLVSTMFIVLPRSAQNLVSTASALSQYDPWCDINHDGKINILDVVAVTSRYGTTGDPALNINVTNWPTSHDVCVWWAQYLTNTEIWNNPCNASGFGHVHVLVEATYLGSGQVTVYFAAPLYNRTRNTYFPIVYYTLVLTPSDYYAAVSVDVPSQSFYFAAVTSSSSVSCYIFLSYYLTWS